ncbi:MAG: SEC-C metal-binding domain-containing protein [Cellulosilyticaceae bacterium]
MTLYEQWDNYGDDARERSTEEYKKVVEKYLTKERDVYSQILSNPDEIIEGTIGELGKRFDMTDVEFLGFVDGINESLKNGTYDLNTLTADSVVKLDYDLSKLYWNMLDAKADWLYNLPQWETLLSEFEKESIKRNFKKSKTVISDKKVGRNDACPCGSGKKYKQCCMNK